MVKTYNIFDNILMCVRIYKNEMDDVNFRHHNETEAARIRKASLSYLKLAGKRKVN